MRILILALALAAAGTVAACAPQTPPVLDIEDNTGGSVAPAPLSISEATDRALDRVKPQPRPEVR